MLARFFSGSSLQSESGAVLGSGVKRVGVGAAGVNGEGVGNNGVNDVGVGAGVSSTTRLHMSRSSSFPWEPHPLPASKPQSLLAALGESSLLLMGNATATTFMLQVQLFYLKSL